MSVQIVFCPECRQDVTYSVKDKKEVVEQESKTYEFISRNAYCDKCGNELYVPELEDENLKAMYAKYRTS